MSPSVQDGDLLLVDRLGVLFRPPARGDVVLIQQPNGVPAVKRVIAVPGDRIEIDAGPPPAPRPVVLLQPGGRGPWERLEEPYVRQGWARADYCCDAGGRDAGRAPAPVTLPPGAFFVMGDNRNVSVDSRDYGFVPRGRVLARALFRYWPRARAGPLSGRTPGS